MSKECVKGNFAVKKDVCAVVVTFNPDIELLRRNLESIVDQVDRIIVIDNGSSNCLQIEALEEVIAFRLLPLDKNLGIATALQKGLNMATEEAYTFLLTMDQDSFFIDKEHAVETMANTLVANEKLAMVGPSLQGDALLVSHAQAKAACEIVSAIITSGALCDIKKLNAVGGFNEELFIDAVDQEICFRLRRKGYLIAQVDFVHLNHNLGQARKHRFLWKKVISMHYSAFRLYYIARNYTYFAREFVDFEENEQFLGFFKNMKTKILLYEKNKFKKLHALNKGFKDGKTFTTKFAIHAVGDSNYT